MFNQLATLLIVATVTQGRVVRRQADGCPYQLLPVLNICPPCQPSACYCADGRELSAEDQIKAQQSQNPPCSPNGENPYGLPHRCSCGGPGDGFTFQEVLAPFLAAQHQAGLQPGHAQRAPDIPSVSQDEYYDDEYDYDADPILEETIPTQVGQTGQTLEQYDPELNNRYRRSPQIFLIPAPYPVPILVPAPVETPYAVPKTATEATTTAAASQPACPRPLLPVLNVCPPCTPTDCYCADGKKLSIEDQAKAQKDGTLPCDVTEENPAGLPARCDCEEPGTGFNFAEILTQLAKQQE